MSADLTEVKTIFELNNTENFEDALFEKLQDSTDPILYLSWCLTNYKSSTSSETKAKVEEIAHGQLSTLANCPDAFTSLERPYPKAMCKTLFPSESNDVVKNSQYIKNYISFLTKLVKDPETKDAVVDLIDQVFQAYSHNSSNTLSYILCPESNLTEIAVSYLDLIESVINYSKSAQKVYGEICVKYHQEIKSTQFGFERLLVLVRNLNIFISGNNRENITNFIVDNLVLTNQLRANRVKTDIHKVF